MPAIKQGDNYDTSNISTTAKAVKKIRMLNGTRFPNKPNTAKAKAISVAIGIAAPFTSGGVLHTNNKIRPARSFHHRRR